MAIYKRRRVSECSTRTTEGRWEVGKKGYTKKGTRQRFEIGNPSNECMNCRVETREGREPNKPGVEERGINRAQLPSIPGHTHCEMANEGRNKTYR